MHESLNSSIDRAENRILYYTMASLFLFCVHNGCHETVVKGLRWLWFHVLGACIVQVLHKNHDLILNLNLTHCATLVQPQWGTQNMKP